VDASGTLVLDAIPAAAEDFVLTIDFSDQRGPVLAKVAALREQAGGYDEELELHLSDLTELALDDQALAELYDNLLFVGVVDEQGRLLDPAVTTVDSTLGVHAARVHALLQERLAAFERRALVIDADAWQPLTLPPARLAELIENLRFNGYLDDGGA